MLIHIPTPLTVKEQANVAIYCGYRVTTFSIVFQYTQVVREIFCFYVHLSLYSGHFYLTCSIRCCLRNRVVEFTSLSDNTYIEEAKVALRDSKLRNHIENTCETKTMLDGLYFTFASNKLPHAQCLS